jgi:phosphohistidine phosphatase
MQLWLVRHAVGVDREDFTGPDAERPLTEKGRRRFRDFCDWLADQTEMPEVVVTSPLVRAADTAAILAKAARLKKSNVLSTDLLAPGVDLTALLELVHEQSAERIAFVGHEPDTSQMLGELIGGGDFDFGKGFIAAIEFAAAPAIGAGRLRWLIGPKLGSPKP